MRNMRDVKRLVYLGATTALIIVATAFLKILVPGTNGYIHLGDGVIFVTAVLLGPWAAVSAGLGSALADMIVGAFYYAPVTFVIKGSMGLLAGLTIKKEGHMIRNLIIFILAELIMLTGYFVYEIFLYGFAPALSAVVFNLIQAVAGVIMGMLFVPAAKNIKL